MTNPDPLATFAAWAVDTVNAREIQHDGRFQAPYEPGPTETRGQRARLSWLRGDRKDQP